MYVFNRDQVKPSIEALLKCHKVSIVVTINRPKVMRDWAKLYCESFIWWESYENTYTEDIVVDYYFIDSKDATLFKLKWC